MSKKDENQRRVGPREDAELALDCLVLQDKDGNYVHIGKLVNKEQLKLPEKQLTEEEQVKAAEAEAWYDAMLDPDTIVQIFDEGVSTGENYVESTERKEE